MVVITGILGPRPGSRGWHLLSQAWESWQEGPFLSPSKLPTEGRLGGEPEVISSDSAAILPQRSSLEDRHLHVALACLLANLCMPKAQSGLCAQTRKDTCDPDNGLGAPIWPGLQLPLDQLCPLLLPTLLLPSLENVA